MKPGSIHATYLLSGIRKTITVEAVNGTGNHYDGDEPMQSSPFDHIAEQSQEVEVEKRERVMLVVGEENLEAAKQTLEGNSSFHIYSLEPGVLNDLQVLTECNRRVTEQSADLDDPLLKGSIRSSNVNRRETSRQVIPQVSKPQPKASTVKKDQSTGTPKSNAPNSETVDSKPSTTKKPVVKKGGADFFRSFPKVTPDARRDSLKAVVPKDKDAPKYDSSSGAEDDEDPIIPASSKQASRKDRSQVHENLRKMMAQEDEPMEDTPESDDAEADEPEDEPMDDEPPPSAQVVVKEEEPPRVEVSGGRRRGKRKVMKNKTYKDEAGFIGLKLPVHFVCLALSVAFWTDGTWRIVTKEEAVWESFSEDDVKPAAPTRPRPVSQQSSKAKAGTGKKDIASFFKRK
ncbi:MAG: hypothetical protein M1814_000704 [Vezdaea aestivalis]|nr:MAG: hypothetical protein M1814_000704 [Vezdaea aestivalis]